MFYKFLIYILQAKENASMLTSSIIQHEQGTMEENLIENEDNAMNKGFPNLLIREKLNQNQIPSYINKAYVIIC
jgi:hypothetical protein